MWGWLYLDAMEVGWHGNFYEIPQMERHKEHAEFRKLAALLTNHHKTTLEKINELQNQIKEIMSKQSDIAQGLTDMTAQMVKIAAESTATLQKVTDLESALGNQTDVSPELQAAFDALKAQVQKTDDLIPDATPPTV